MKHIMQNFLNKKKVAIMFLTLLLIILYGLFNLTPSVQAKFISFKKTPNILSLVVNCGPPQLDHIAIAQPPYATTYAIDTAFEPIGMVVIASYTDGTWKEISDDEYTWAPLIFTTDGKQDVTISYTEDDITKTTAQEVNVEPKWLKFTACDDGAVFGVSRDTSKNGFVNGLQLSYDTVNWHDAEVDPNVVDGVYTFDASDDYVYLKAHNENWADKYNGIGRFDMIHGRIYASGNINCLINAGEDSVDELPARVFKRLFSTINSSDYSYLVHAPQLPATKLSTDCYNSMFYKNASLEEAPLLPATELAVSCYSSMFYGCTSLVVAPDLPATSMYNKCYSFMFADCHLGTAPHLPATQLAANCYESMFRNNSFLVSPALPATVLADACYKGMFQNCTHLKEISELPATVLVKECYSSMFVGCSSLNITSSSGDNIIFTCPSTSGISNPVTDMFKEIDGDDTYKTPIDGETYYWN